MIRVHYNDNGVIQGFYPEDIQYDFIPKPYILIDDKTHREILNGKRVKVIDNQIQDLSAEEIEAERQRNLKLIAIQEIDSKLEELDKKTIRAIREGGNTPDGISYLDFYKEQIESLRQERRTITNENE